MATILFGAFVIFLYVPHLLFKFALANKFQLGPRKDATQIEEFFAASLPSALLNLIAFALLSAALLPLGRRLPGIAWSVVALTFRSDRPELAAQLGTIDWTWSAVCIANLYVQAYWWGRTYGVIEARILFLNKLVISANMSTWPRLNRFGLRLELWYRSIWRVFYVEYLSTLYPSVVRAANVFVRTKDRLFYGRLFSYEKKPSGEPESIYLVEAYRCMIDTSDEMIARGLHPLRRLTGPLLVKWSEIVDINFAEPHAFAELAARYDDRLQRATFHTLSSRQ